MRLNEKKNMPVTRAIQLWSNLDGTREETKMTRSISWWLIWYRRVNSSLAGNGEAESF